MTKDLVTALCGRLTPRIVQLSEHVTTTQIGGLDSRLELPSRLWPLRASACGQCAPRCELGTLRYCWTRGLRWGRDSDLCRTRRNSRRGSKHERESTRPQRKLGS